MSAAFWFMVAVAIIGGIAFVPVVIWLEGRTKEREAHYRNELVKQITASNGADAALDYLREIDRKQARSARNGLRLAGMITIAVGIGLAAFLAAIEPQEPVYLIGLIPGLVGVVLLFSARFSGTSDD